MTEPKPQITEAGGPEHYPVLPLRDIVVFPYMIVPLFVGREKSIAALEEVMRTDKQIERRVGKKTLGFKADVKSLRSRDIGATLEQLEPQDLIKYGLIPEFVGRLPVVGTLHELDKAALIQILTQPRNAITRQYMKLFEYENVKLRFTDDALDAIAESALDRKIGARGLRSIMEGVLLDTMFELPSLRGVEEVVISSEVIEGKARPLRIYSDRHEELGSSA